MRSCLAFCVIALSACVQTVDRQLPSPRPEPVLSSAERPGGDDVVRGERSIAARLSAFGEIFSNVARKPQDEKFSPAVVAFVSAQDEQFANMCMDLASAFASAADDRASEAGIRQLLCTPARMNAMKVLAAEFEQTKASLPGPEPPGSFTDTARFLRGAYNECLLHP